MRAVIYVGTSNPMLRNHQLARCQHLAATEHYQVVLTITGTRCDDQDRSGLHTLRILVQNDVMDTIIVMDEPQFCRQPVELQAFLALCQAHNVHIRTVNGRQGVLMERAVGA